MNDYFIAAVLRRPIFYASTHDVFGMPRREWVALLALCRGKAVRKHRCVCVCVCVCVCENGRVYACLSDGAYQCFVKAWASRVMCNYLPLKYSDTWIGKVYLSSTSLMVLRRSQGSYLADLLPLLLEVVLCGAGLGKGFKRHSAHLAKPLMTW